MKSLSHLKRKIGALALACLTLYMCAFSNAAVVLAAPDGVEFHISVVHTNDTHARVRADDDNQVIGLSKLKTYVDKTAKDSDLSLLLDGGDTFHGQSFATLAKGASIARLLGACGYDAMAAGNHDWNYGADRLKQLEQVVRQNGGEGFAILAGNVASGSDSRFFDEQFIIREAQKDGLTLKVGVFGVIDPAVYNATAPENVEGVRFTDMAAYSKQAAEQLKEQGCQIVVGLAHCNDPRALAAQIDGVDLWIAGHEHMTINETLKRPDGGNTLVVETGFNMWSFGDVKIDCTLNRDGSVASLTMTENLIDYETGKALNPNAKLESMITEIEAAQQEVLTLKVGFAPVELDGVWEHVRIGETTMGRAITQAYLLETNADIAFENAGGIRASIPRGDVTYRHVLDVSPYGNYIVTKQLSGRQILEMLETSLEIMRTNIEANEKGENDGWPENSGSVLQVAGMQVSYDMSLENGARITNALVQGAALDEAAQYTVAMNNYLPGDTASYRQLADAPNVNEYSSCEDALAEYLGLSPDIVAAALSTVRLLSPDAQPVDSIAPVQPLDSAAGGSTVVLTPKPQPTPTPAGEAASGTQSERLIVIAALAVFIIIVVIFVVVSKKKKAGKK